MWHKIIVTDNPKRPYACQYCGLSWRREPGMSLCPGIRWYPWKSAPEYLCTYSQLRARHLKPADRSKPDGCITVKDGWCYLYDERQSVHRRLCSDRQRQALEVARRTQRDKWKCRHCGYEPSSLAAMRHYFACPGLCRNCEERIKYETMIYSDCLEEVEWARAILVRHDWCVLDTETTSLDGYPVEIAVVAPDGSTLFHSLINPPRPVESGARAVHGISDDELAIAPTLPEIWSDLLMALMGCSLVLAYGVDFDHAVMDRAASYYRLPKLPCKWQCLKLGYAQYCGDWSDYWQSYRWIPLDGGHRALSDARAALSVLHEMAEGAALNEDKQI